MPLFTCWERWREREGRKEGERDRSRGQQKIRGAGRKLGEMQKRPGQKERWQGKRVRARQQKANSTRLTKSALFSIPTIRIQ